MIIKQGLFFSLMISILVCSCVCDPKQVVDDTLVIGVESKPENLDPRYSTGANSQYVNGLIYASLIKYDQQARIVPDVAAKWEILSSTHYRFFLRKGVFFHHGKELKARDVKATYDNIRDPNLSPPSPRSHGYKVVKEIKVIDDYTVDFILSETNATFVGELVIGIIPADMISSPKYHQELIGAGPYQLISKSDNKIILKSFPKYFNGPAKTSKLVFKVIQDANTRYLKLLEGSIDILQNSLPKNKLKLLSQKDFTVIREKGLNTAYLGFNFKDQVLNKKAVRKAIAFALNKGEIIKYELEGWADEANSLLPPFTEYYAKDLIVYQQDKEKAKKLLDSAGYPDVDGKGPKMRFTLSFKTFNDKTQIGIAKLIGAQLKQVGIGMKIESYEWGTFYRDIKNGDFQLFSLRWVGFKDPDLYHYIFHSDLIPTPKSSGGNRGRYKNDEIDRLTVLARREPQTSIRKKYYRKIQQIVADDLPYVNLWHTHNFVVLRNNIKGYELYPDGQMISLLRTYKAHQ